MKTTECVGVYDERLLSQKRPTNEGITPDEGVMGCTNEMFWC